MGIDEFENKWQMSNCLSSIDGKHIVHQVIINYLIVPIHLIK